MYKDLKCPKGSLTCSNGSNGEREIKKKEKNKTKVRCGKMCK